MWLGHALEVLVVERPSDESISRYIAWLRRLLTLSYKRPDLDRRALVVPEVAEAVDELAQNLFERVEFGYDNKGQRQFARPVWFRNAYEVARMARQGPSLRTELLAWFESPNLDKVTVAGTLLASEELALAERDATAGVLRRHGIDSEWALTFVYRQRLGDRFRNDLKAIEMANGAHRAIALAILGAQAGEITPATSTAIADCVTHPQQIWLETHDLLQKLVATSPAAWIEVAVRAGAHLACTGYDWIDRALDALPREPRIEALERLKLLSDHHINWIGAQPRRAIRIADWYEGRRYRARFS
jgi:hypothetical protein